GFDLDRFAGLRIASHAGFAMRLHQTAQAGNDEHAVLLGLFDCGVSKVLEKRCSGLVVGAEFFGEMTGQLGLGHTRCHESSLGDRRDFLAEPLHLSAPRLWKNSVLCRFYAVFCEARPKNRPKTKLFGPSRSILG